MNKSYIVDSTCNDMRIDRWMRLNVGKIPQGLIEKYRRTGKIKINKKKVKSSHKIKKGDQINIFNNANVIIGPHGAGFANLVFCKNSTKVIELRPKNHPNKVFESISSINKLNHKLIKLKHIKNNKKGDMFLKKEILTDFI